MKQLIKTMHKSISINLPTKLTHEIEIMIQEEPKYSSKSQFVETAIKMYLRRIKDNKNML